MITVLFSVFAIVTTYIIWILFRELHFWRKTGVKFIGFWDAVKDNYRLLIKPLPEHTLENYKKYGRVFGTYAGGERTIWIGEPELLKKIYIKNFNCFSDRIKIQKVNNAIWDKMLMNLTGEEWKHVRSAMSPSMSSGKLKQMVSTIIKICDCTAENLLEGAEKGSSLDVKQIFGAFSLDTIARLAFAVNLNSHKDLTNPFVTHAKEAFGEVGGKNFFYGTIFPWYFKLMRKPASPQYVLDFYNSFTRTVISEREKEANENSADFLELMLNTRRNLQKKKETVNGSASEKENTLQNIFDFDCIVAQSILFFLAAYDTTGSTLTFIAYELALNLDIQDKLIMEIDEHIKTKDDITYENISDMPYLEAVINETFRKRSIVARLFRLCVEDVTIGDYHITKGTTINIPAHGIHNDPEFYPEPEKFNPDRFLPENKANHLPFTFLPFGEGPRHCIGMRLAMMEIKIALITILKKVKFQKCSETEIPLQIMPRNFMTSPNRAIKLNVVKRE